MPTHYESKENDAKIIENIYDNNTAIISLQKKSKRLGKSFGQSMKPEDMILSKLHMFECILGKMNWEGTGVNINVEYLNHLQFADIFLISESSVRLQ